MFNSLIEPVNRFINLHDSDVHLLSLLLLFLFLILSVFILILIILIIFIIIIILLFYYYLFFLLVLSSSLLLLSYYRHHVRLKIGCSKIAIAFFEFFLCNSYHSPLSFCTLLVLSRFCGPSVFE